MNAYTSRISWYDPIRSAGTYTGTLCGVPFSVLITSNAQGTCKASRWQATIRVADRVRQIHGYEGGMKAAAERARWAIREEVAAVREDAVPA